MFLSAAWSATLFAFDSLVSDAMMIVQSPLFPLNEPVVPTPGSSVGSGVGSVVGSGDGVSSGATVASGLSGSTVGVASGFNGSTVAVGTGSVVGSCEGV